MVNRKTLIAYIIVSLIAIGYALWWMAYDDIGYYRKPDLEDCFDAIIANPSYAVGYSLPTLLLVTVLFIPIHRATKPPVYKNKIEQGKAEQGEVKYAVGLKYLHGKKGVLEDYAEALKWFKEAAFLGHVKSQYQLGLMYFNGSGVEKDLSEAYAWALLEAAGGSPNLKNKISSRLSEEQKMAGQIRAKELSEEMGISLISWHRPIPKHPRRNLS